MEAIRDTTHGIYGARKCPFRTGRALFLIGLVGVLGLLPVTSPNLFGEYYRYQDEHGHTHFIDDYGRIPLRYRTAVRIYPEVYDPLASKNGNPCRADDSYGALYLRGADNGRLDPSATPAAPLQTPVALHGNLVLVPVVLTHRGKDLSVRMLLDTGAATSVLYEEAARRLNLQGGQRREARLVDGKSITVQDLTIPAMRLGPFRLENVAAALIRHTDPDIPYQGLLGMNVLRHLSYAIDFDRRLIRWHIDESARDLHAHCTPP